MAIFMHLSFYLEEIPRVFGRYDVHRCVAILCASLKKEYVLQAFAHFGAEQVADEAKG
jgi:hypothetical protein